MASGVTHPSDSALVRAALEGDVNSFGTLIERHFQVAYAVGLARLRDPEQAEDLAQEVFLRAQLHLDQLGPTGNFPGWVCRIARNLALNWLRQGQRASRLLPLVPLEEDVMQSVKCDTPSARETLAAQENSKALHEALFGLPAEQREMLLLHYMGGATQREIASRLGINQATVCRQIKLALRTLRGTLEPVLHQALPRLSVPQRAVAKSLMIATSVGVMSGSAKATLAASATVSPWVSSTESAGAGSAGAMGLIGFLKSLPALIAGGGQVLVTGKGIVATITAAAAITAGGLYMKTQGQPPTASTAQTRGAPSRLIDGAPVLRERQAYTPGGVVEVHVTQGETLRIPCEPNSFGLQELEMTIDPSGSILIISSSWQTSDGQNRIQAYGTPLSEGQITNFTPLPHSYAVWEPREGGGLRIQFACDGDNQQFNRAYAEINGRFSAGEISLEERSDQITELIAMHWRLRIRVAAAPIYPGSSAQEWRDYQMPETPGAFAVAPDGQATEMLRLADEDVDRLRRAGMAGTEADREVWREIIDRSSAPTVPRDVRITVNDPLFADVEPSTTPIQVVPLSLPDLSVAPHRIDQHRITESDGAWGAIPRVPLMGDVIMVTNADRGGDLQAVWIARLEDLAFPEERAVYTVASDGRMASLPEFTLDEMERFRSVTLGRAPRGADFADLELPAIPRDFHLIITRFSPLLHANYPPGPYILEQGWQIEQIGAEDTRASGLSLVSRDYPNSVGAWEVTAFAPPEGDVLAVTWRSPIDDGGSVWLARLGEE